MKVWWCRDAFGNERLFNEPCGGADSAEGCGWKQLVSVDPVGFLVYGEFIPYDIWVKHLPFAAPVDQVVALYAQVGEPRT